MQENGEISDKFHGIKYSSKKNGRYAYSRDYYNDLTTKRKLKPENMELKRIITQRLEELGQSQNWLAAQVKESLSLVNHYATGYTMPNPDTLWLILNALDVDSSTLKYIKI